MIWIVVLLLDLLLSLIPVSSDVKDNWISSTELNNLRRKEIFIKIARTQNNKNYERVFEITNAIYVVERNLSLHHNTIISIIHIESDFAPSVISSAGAVGLMQVMPVWTNNGAECYGKNLLDVYDNISCGVAIFKHYLKIYKNFELALMVYNKGPKIINKSLIENSNPITEYVDNFYKSNNIISERGL